MTKLELMNRIVENHNRIAKMLVSSDNAIRNLLIQIGASPPGAVSAGSSITLAFINGLKMLLITYYKILTSSKKYAII